MLAPVGYVQNSLKERESRKQPQKRRPKNLKPPKTRSPVSIKVGDHVDITA